MKAYLGLSKIEDVPILADLKTGAFCRRTLNNTVYTEAETVLLK